MPFGDEPLGSVPLGYSSVSSAIPAVQQRQQALLFDAETRDYLLDEDGRYIATDPATAACQAALFFLRNRIPCAPNNGTTLDKVRPGTQRTKAEADDAIRVALDPIVRRGWISNVRIRVQSTRSGIKTEVTVYNHLTGDRDAVVYSNEGAV